MPDTGAPWNIPYVESTDLVSAWPAASLAVANAVASGLSAAGGIAQIVVDQTTTQTATSSTSFQATELSLSITPTSDTSTILLLFTATVGSNQTYSLVEVELRRGSTQIATGRSGIVSPSGWSFTGSRQQVVAINYLDSPATTSATTYDIRFKGGGNGETVNLPQSGYDAALIAVEVKA